MFSFPFLISFKGVVGENYNIPMSTDGSGTPTTSPKTGSPV